MHGGKGCVVGHGQQAGQLEAEMEGVRHRLMLGGSHWGQTPPDGSVTSRIHVFIWGAMGSPRKVCYKGGMGSTLILDR